MAPFFEVESAQFEAGGLDLGAGSSLFTLFREYHGISALFVALALLIVLILDIPSYFPSRLMFLTSKINLSCGGVRKVVLEAFFSHVFSFKKGFFEGVSICLTL